MMKPQNFLMKNNNGQSLFEVVFAVGMVALVLITLVSLATVSIRNAGNSKNTDLATRAAQDATEWIRGQRDSDWVAFSSKAPGVYCLQVLGSWPAQGNCTNQYISGTTILRSATLTVIDTATIQADVKSLWSDAQGSHQIVSSTYFTKWR